MVEFIEAQSFKNLYSIRTSLLIQIFRTQLFAVRYNFFPANKIIGRYPVFRSLYIDSGSKGK